MARSLPTLFSRQQPLAEPAEQLATLHRLPIARSFDAEEKELLFLALQARFLKNHSRVLAALGQSTEAIAATRP